MPTSISTPQEIKDAVEPVVLRVVMELFGTERAVLDHYLTTRGYTDWVWLEETMSLYVHETLDELSDYEQWLAYLAGFGEVVGEIRARFPAFEINPPAWWTYETAPHTVKLRDALVAAGHNPDHVQMFVTDEIGEINESTTAEDFDEWRDRRRKQIKQHDDYLARKARERNS